LSAEALSEAGSGGLQIRLQTDDDGPGVPAENVRKYLGVAGAPTKRHRAVVLGFLSFVISQRSMTVMSPLALRLLAG